MISHIWKILKRHIKTSCKTLVQNVLIQSSHKGAKTGLRPRFYLNCSHLLVHHIAIVVIVLRAFYLNSC